MNNQKDYSNHLKKQEDMKTDPSKEVSIDAVDLDFSKLAKKLSKDTFSKSFDRSFSSKSFDSDSFDSSTDNIPQDRDELEKMRIVAKTFDGNTDFGITVPGFGGIKLGKKETTLSVYYIETKVVEKGNSSTVYGCGYSVHYLFKKVRGGLDLSDLPTISASVHLENRKTQVYYSLQTYGIIGQNLVKFFKPNVNKKFDVEGFGIMQSSIDGIHNILGDPALSKSVRFKPEILKFVTPYELEQL